MPIFSLLALSLGATATEMTGAGNTIGSSVAGCFVAQRVAGLHVLQADERDDVAGLRRLDQRAVVGVHLDHAADALGLAGEGVEHRCALGDRARVDAGEGQAAEAVVHDLERERAEGLVGSTMANLPVGLPSRSTSGCGGTSIGFGR